MLCQYLKCFTRMCSDLFVFAIYWIESMILEKHVSVWAVEISIFTVKMHKLCLELISGKVLRQQSILGKTYK